MKTDYIAVNGVEDGIDFDAHYRLYLKVGIAWVLLGWEKKFEPITFLANDDEGNEYEEESGEFDEVADHEHIVAVMVGDDRRAPGDKYARAFYAGRSDAEGNGWYSFNGGEVWARKSVLADWQNATVQEKEIAAVEAARRSRRERLKSAIAAVYRVDKGIKITVSKEK